MSIRGRLACAALFSYCVSAQPNTGYRIDTIAGAIPNQDGIPALEALFFRPLALATGKDGAILISDPLFGIRSVARDGVITTIKPGVFPSESIAGDASGLVCSVSGPQFWRAKPNGDTDTWNPLQNLGLTGATLRSVAIRPDGVPFVSLRNSSVILQINENQSAQPIANVRAILDRSLSPNRLAFDKAGTLYFSTLGQQIYRMTPASEISLVAGIGNYGPAVVGAEATKSPFQNITAFAPGIDGDIFVYDSFARNVYAINASGVIDRVAWAGDAVDIAVNQDGSLLVLDRGGILTAIKPNDERTVIAGRATFYGEGGPAAEAGLNSPMAAVPDGAGGYYVADSGNYRIRRASAEGTITTAVGTGVAGFSGDGGPGVEAQIPGAGPLAVDQDGSLYFASMGGSTVRRLRPDGVVERVAGSGFSGDSGDDGPAIEAQFQSIGGLAVDKTGALFISDQRANRIRVVRDGKIYPYAGTGFPGFGGQEAPAKDSPLIGPTAMAFDSYGDLYFFETTPARIRKVAAASGILSTFTGTNPPDKPVNDSAKELCSMFSVSGISFDADDNLIVAGQSRVCRIGKDGVATPLAGSRMSGFAGDGGPALEGLLGGTIGVAADSAGSILVADPGNHRVRRLTPVQ